MEKQLVAKTENLQNLTGSLQNPSVKEGDRKINNIKHSKEIFFTGAGFTKAINPNMPLLSELTNIVDEHLENNALKLHYQSLPKTLVNNIEDTLTYLSAKLPWKSETQLALDNALFIAITQILSQYFVHFDKNEIFAAGANKFKDLWFYMYLNSVVTITLNYDIYLEILLRNAANYMSYLEKQVLQGKNIADYDEKYRPLIDPFRLKGGVSVEEKHHLSMEGLYSGVIQHISSRFKKHLGLYDGPVVYKLHGSANWYYSPDNNSNQIFCTSHDNSEEDNYIFELIPYIIPPVLDKTQFYSNNLLKYIWTNAREELLSATHLYIIGFSLPPTDLSVKYLLKSFKEQNPNCKVSIINTKEALPVLEGRYKEIFGEDVDFKYCCDNSLELFMKKIIAPKLFAGHKINL